MRDNLPTPLRDFELDAIQLGPATRMLVLESDPQGGVYYQFGQREPRLLQLGALNGGRRLLVIDQVQCALLLDPDSRELIALGSITSAGTNVALFGRHWGRWFDTDGEAHQESDVLARIARWKTPVTVDARRGIIASDFLINIYHREIFTRDAMLGFREGNVRHVLTLDFAVASGGFIDAEIEVRDANTERLRLHHHVGGFPFNLNRVPGALQDSPPQEFVGTKGARKPASLAGRTAAAAKIATDGDDADPLEEALRRKRDRLREARQTAAKAPHAETTPTPPLLPPPTGNGNHATEKPPARPLPRTEGLPTHELLAVLSTETEIDRRWKIIESNLMLGRPERTYPLVLNYPDIIAERTSEWPAARLKTAFAHQPGSVLTAVMTGWCNNQILAVAEDNAETARIMDWLAEREMDRLLAMKLDREPTSAAEARALLNIDRNAEAAAIKRTWRTLLSIINADRGRREERAIHRRKDEIAKHLQTARNLLMK